MWRWSGVAKASLMGGAETVFFGITGRVDHC